MSKGLVLVSGATGFVGTEVARAFVDAGYSVRGTSRTQSKIDQWNQFNPEYAGKVEWTIVPDAGTPNAFDEAIKGVDYVAHTASPFHYHIKDNEKDMLIPALQGTKYMLAAAKREPKVKHFVITSSVAAIADPLCFPGVGLNFDRDSWNPATWEQAVKSDHPGFVYCASKKFGEKAAWDDEERNFPVTAICPGMVFGPAHQPIDKMASLNTSNMTLYSIMTGGKIGPNIPPVGIDVRDVAALHVKALDSLPPSGKPKAHRFLSVAWHYYNHEFADVLLTSPELEKADPGLKSRVSTDRSADQPYEHFTTDSGPTEQLLGRKFIDKETCFRDTALRLLELSKMLPQ